MGLLPLLRHSTSFSKLQSDWVKAGRRNVSRRSCVNGSSAAMPLQVPGDKVS